MFIVLGATGHVGSAVVEELLGAGENVTAVVRNERKAAALQAKGATIAEVDVGEVDALRAILRTRRRAFLLNPPAPVSGDTDAEDRRTASAIVEAVEGSGLEMVVAQPTYGAQPGRGKGDLSVLYEFEEALRAQPIPTTIQRGAYYMSNWDPMLDAAGQVVSYRRCSPPTSPFRWSILPTWVAKQLRSCDRGRNRPERFTLRDRSATLHRTLRTPSPPRLAIRSWSPSRLPRSGWTRSGTSASRWRLRDLMQA